MNTPTPPLFYLQRLQLQQVRKFDALELTDLQPGLNIFTGPNGAGKSTIARALRAVFLERYGSSSAADLQPLHNSAAAPQVALDFILHNQPYQLVKSFLKKKRCDLSTPTQRWSGQEAEDYLAATLGFSYAPKGKKPDFWGVPGLLWVEQGAASAEFVASVQHASSHLHAALHSQAAAATAATAASSPPNASMAGLAATAGDALIAQLEQELALYLGKTGKPVGQFAQTLANLAEDEAELVQLQQRIAQYCSQVDALALALQEQAEDARQRPELAWQQALTQAQERLQQGQQLQQRQQHSQQQWQHVQSRIQLLAHNLQAHAQQTQQLQDRQHTLTQAQAQEQAAQAALAQAQQHADAAQQQHQQAQTLWQQADVAQRHLQQRHTLEQRLAQAQQQAQWLQERWTQAQEQLQKLKLLAQSQSGFALEKADILQLQKLEQAVQTASVQYQAQATQVAFTLAAPLAWHTDSAQGQWQGQGQVALDAPTHLTLPDGGQLRITPGGQHVTQAAHVLAQARNALAATLQRLGQPDVATAQSAWEQHQHHLQQQALAQQALQLLAPEGVDALASACTQAQTLIATCQAQCQAMPPAPTPHAANPGLQDIHTLQAQAQAAQAAWEQAQQQHAQAQQRHALAQQHCQSAQREYAALAEQISSPSASQQQQALQQEQAQLQAQAEALQQTLHTLAQALAAPDLQFAAQDSERLQASLAAHARKTQERQQRIAQLQAHLEAVGGTGLEEQAASVQGRIQQQQRHTQAMQHHAQALQYLLQCLKTARAGAVQRLQAPLAQRMQHYLQLLQPGAQLALDEQLLPLQVHLPMQAAEHTTAPSSTPSLVGEIGQLSYGSKEQLSILSRLAYADLLRQAGQPTLLMFDDALVHSDPQRLAHMKRALFDAAQRHQVLLFTCRPQDWGDAGAPLRLL